MGISRHTDTAKDLTPVIFRMGYYGGKGARLMRSLGPLQGVVQPTPEDGVRNVRECKWSVGFSLSIPQDWLSGVYLGKLTSLESDAEAYVVFIVRDDRRVDLLFQSSDMTWSSYNRWPQWRSLYDNGDDHWGASNGRPGYDVGQKGNLVFNAGTCWWNMVLSSPPGFMSPPRRYFKEPDARLQRITRNVLNKMIAVAPAER